MYGNSIDKEYFGKAFSRDINRNRMPKNCPVCGAMKTNVGHLKHYGYYTGYACRTIYLDGDQYPFKQSDNCKIDGRIRIINENILVRK